VKYKNLEKLNYEAEGCKFNTTNSLIVGFRLYQKKMDTGINIYVLPEVIKN